MCFIYEPAEEWIILQTVSSRYSDKGACIFLKIISRKKKKLGVRIRHHRQQKAKSEFWRWLRISFVTHHTEPTLNRRMAVIQQVLVCSSSAQSSFKSRAELDFENCWRVKTKRKRQFKMLGINDPPCSPLVTVRTRGSGSTLTQRP